MERSSSKFPQTRLFFVQNIQDLAQTVLNWEAKVIAAGNVMKMNWKHKVTPDQGDLIIASVHFSQVNTTEPY